ncbi:unnamed protein product [Mytilus coruscus]|uniref:Ig-like domain-containing protein n=1 Tax=Mytilus coruscus TaxID=42192 RepID=A0A6J8F471_MYTCO|nr:unnamed protein product [Mytilus coruscus]
MTLFSGILELLVLPTVLCVVGSLEQGVHYTNETVFAGMNETVVLNCYRVDKSECAWRIMKKQVPSSMDSNATDKTYTLYTEGHSLNPKLHNTNIDIIGGTNTGKCNLKIRSFSAADEGSYTCNFFTLLTYTHYFAYNVQLKSTPDGILTILNSSNRLHETDGIYKCKASNGIYGTKRHLYQIGTTLVHNKVPPIFVNANKPIQFGRYGQKMNLTVLLYNKYGTIQTTISKLFKPLNTETRQETIKTQDISHDVNVTVSGIKITFQLTLDKIEDFTDYTIQACNEMGCNELTVKITSASKLINK